MCQRDTQLEFWYLQRPKGGADGEAKAAKALPEGQHVLRVSLEGAREGRHLGASAIAPDGCHLAASDEAGTRLFRTNLEDLEVRRVTELPAELRKASSRALLFCTPALLAVAPRKSKEVLVLDVKQLSVVARFTEHRAPVASFAASRGGEWLASADLTGVTHVFSLDSLAHHAQVPVGSYEGFPTAMGFDSGRHRLVVVTSTHAVLVFDVEAQTLAAGVPSPLRIPRSVLRPSARVCGVAAPPGTSGRLLLWGHDFMVRLDPAAPAGKDVAEDTPQKRKAAESDVPQRWRKYDDMQHIIALCALEEAQWGAPVLSQGGANQSTGKKKRKSGGGGGAAALPAMVLTMEVAPATLKKALPEAFERKQFNTLRKPTA